MIMNVRNLNSKFKEFGIFKSIKYMSSEFGNSHNMHKISPKTPIGYSTIKAEYQSHVMTLILILNPEVR